MKTRISWIVGSLVSITLACLIITDFAEARRGGGGGRGGGRSMSRGGPASSGSFNRSRARPQRSQQPSMSNRTGVNRSGNSNSRYTGRPANTGTRPTTQPATRPESRPNTGGGTRPETRPEGNRGENSDRQDRIDQGKDDRQDHLDQRQDNIDERQDFAREVHDDRSEWYEDRWRTGAYISVSSWNSMNCAYTRAVVNGITYYDCAGVRYERVYRGSSVTYIIVN